MRAARKPEHCGRKPETKRSEAACNRLQVVFRGKNARRTDQAANLKNERKKSGKIDEAQRAQEYPSGNLMVGHFQAAWTITQQYIALVLTAMAADYYPRLTGIVRDRAAAVKLVNEQTEIALLLSGPIFLAMMALAPWVLRLLYTADFAPAVVVLRWMVLSDVLKVASWPLGFIFLAMADGKTFLWTEVSALLLMGLAIAIFLPHVGLEMTGIGYLACYAFYLPLMHWLAKTRLGFAWQPAVIRLLGVTFIAVAAIGIAVSITRWGAWIGCIAALAFGIYALGRLSHMSDLGGPAGKLGAMARKLTGVVRR